MLTTNILVAMYNVKFKYRSVALASQIPCTSRFENLERPKFIFYNGALHKVK